MIAILQAGITIILAAIVIGLLAYHIRSQRQVKKSNTELVQSYQLLGLALHQLIGAVDSIDLAAIKSAVGLGGRENPRLVRQYSLESPDPSGAGGFTSLEYRQFFYLGKRQSFVDVNLARAAVECIHHVQKKAPTPIHYRGFRYHQTIIKPIYGDTTALKYMSGSQERPGDWYTPSHSRFGVEDIGLDLYGEMAYVKPKRM